MSKQQELIKDLLKYVFENENFPNDYKELKKIICVNNASKLKSFSKSYKLLENTNILISGKLNPELIDIYKINDITSFVSILDMQEARQIDVEITDKAGRYGFLLENKKYLLRINVPGYKIANINQKLNSVQLPSGENVLEVEAKNISNLYIGMEKILGTDKLDNSMFARINNYSIVNLSYVKEIRKEDVILQDGTSVLFSRNRKKDFIDAFTSFMNGDIAINDR